MKTNIINYYELPLIEVGNVTVKDLNSSFVYTNKSRYIPVIEFLTDKLPSVHISDCSLYEGTLHINVENISIKDIKSISNIFNTTNLKITSSGGYEDIAYINISIKLE